jgi:hypothetical protein
LIGGNVARKLVAPSLSEETMRLITIAAALAVGLAVPDLAAARANRAGGMVAQNAPPGHRQPAAKDVPPEPATRPVAVTKEDRALDRALKGICKGC